MGWVPALTIPLVTMRTQARRQRVPGPVLLSSPCRNGLRYRHGSKAGGTPGSAAALGCRGQDTCGTWPGCAGRGAVEAALKKTVTLQAGRDLGRGGQVNVSSAVWFYQCFLSILLFCSILVVYLYKCCLLVLILRIDLKAMT